MSKRGYTDTDFEVISGPSPVLWQPKRRLTQDELLAPLRWLWFGLFGFAFLMTLAVGLGGGDIDTKTPVAVAAPRDPNAIPIPSVEVPGNVREARQR